MIKTEQKISIYNIVADYIIYNFSLLLSFFIKNGHLGLDHRYRVFFLIYNLTWLIVVLSKHSYTNYWLNTYKMMLKTQIPIFLTHVGILSFIIIFFKELILSRQVVSASLIIFFSCRSVIGFLMIYFLIHYYINLNINNVLIIGAGETGQKVYHVLNEQKRFGVHIIGFLDDNIKGKNENDLIIGKVYDLGKLLKTHLVDEISIALPFTAEHEIRYIIETADHHGIRIRLIPRFDSLVGRKYTVQYIDNLSVINIREIPLDELVNQMLKRVFDIIFSCIILILLLPIFILIGIIIKLESRGPVFYKPTRIGMKGSKFNMYKFRTMTSIDDEIRGKSSTQKNDPRITNFGKFLRSYSLDELPQFWNVLKNDMSIVGPRPHRIWLNKKMQKKIVGYMVRHYLKPGITGWAQANGLRGLLENDEQMATRTQYDLWYIENWSFRLDIKIIFMTIFGTKVRRNAF